MKEFSLSIFLLLVSSIVFAQDCIMYFPQEEGTIFEITNYSPKDKVESVSLNEILNKDVDGSDVTIHAQVSQYSNNNQDTIVVDYTAGCMKGVFQINMFTGLQNSGGSFMELDGDFLDIPANPSAGQKLEDKLIILKIAPNAETGEALLNFKYNFVNRLVESIEKITTPAGTFDAVKMSYDVTVRIPFPVTLHVVEWYSKDVGQVRSETYNSKGKSKGYSVLTKFN
ncbi:MAG: hypothetical protein OEW75_09230 [Cyclobacteriaceae bacterium]|nr:hypothetical protein [Cyclobacteriaceae bacterium]